MRVAIVGLGRVGSALAFCLIQNKNLSGLTLIDRDHSKAECLKMDLVSGFPHLGGIVQSGELKDAVNADVITITAGVQGSPTGNSLLEANTKVMEWVFEGLRFKAGVKIIVCATPVDKVVNVARRLAKINDKCVIGFGGQLDLNRLKYLIFSDLNDFSKTLDAQYVGEHGSRGIPVFSENVSNRDELTQESKFFFSRRLAKQVPWNFATASEMAKLIEALSKESDTTLTVSYFDKARNTYLTWPCRINNTGIVAPLEVKLTDDQKKELDALFQSR
jgi:L-lactate dehydrogenase